MAKTLIIEGQNIDGIASFYDEINRVFMGHEDWTLGPSLDALNDLFYGGFGAIDGAEPVTLVWNNIAQSRTALGLDATREHYRAKLDRPDIYDRARIEQDIEAIEAGVGPTYFEIIREIIAEHPNIELCEA
ncbi:barstar family protein [Novosphingobium panipatense]|uniref:Barstar family protein n=1 Tax=Sphingobium yanoikuyae TaxID=13690 RepID=A0A3G2ULJ6_SPHYA|nr:barstar family protein [Sphingobium yanoikuyae]AYO75484.1 ribonuclease inhibitor [Sphingobium yanoikuyae]QNG49758.1 barstar family protein [Sphingobium yanoikuyae]